MGTTAEKINYAINATNDIAEKIVELGGNITPQTPLGNFANELETIYNNSPKTTAEGTSLSITDARAGKMIIQPKGNTIQNSYSGKNIADITNIPDRTSDNIKIIIENDTITIKDNTNTAGYTNTTIKLSELCPNLQVGDTVYLFFKTTSTASMKNRIYLNGSSVGWYKDAAKTITQEMLDSVVHVYGGYEETAVISNFMITKENDDTYEPYVGENPAPNPDYPQEIKNVREDNNVVIRGKNLLNRTTCQENSGLMWINGEYYSESDSLSSDFIEINYNQTYVMTYIAQIMFYNESKTYLGCLQADGVTISTTPSNFRNKIFTVPNNSSIKYIKLGFRKSFNDGVDLLIANIQVEEGSTATQYEPYITPIEKPLNLKSINLFDKDNANIVDALINNYTMTPSAVIKSLYIKCKPNTTYTVSKILSARLIVATSNIEVTRNSETISQRIQENDDTSITLTTDANANYLVLQYYHADYDTLTEQEILNTVQIEEGTTATDYVPYYDYTLSKIGDYQDIIFKNEPSNPNYDNTLVENGWYKKNVIGKKVYNGTENWNVNSTGTNSWSYRCALNLGFVGITSNSNGYCNLYKPVLISSSNTTQGIHYGSSGYVAIRYGEEDTIENFKTFLSNNNCILYGILQTPTYTQITETTLINQLESLNRTIIPNETIIIETESDEENAQLVVNAKALKGE